MSNHLPECLHDDDTYGLRGLCICDELRACEQRVRQSAATLWDRTSEQMAAARVEGIRAGLDAAREAVKALHHQHPLIWPTDVGAMQALDAAIDALQEKPLASGGIYAGPPIPLGDGCVIPKSDAIDALKEKP